MIKKIFLNGIIVFLISLPIIVFLVYFFRTFWGAEYILNVDQTNITAISEVLAEDNINVDNLNDVNKIEICGAGLNDYVNIKFYISSIRSFCKLQKLLFYLVHPLLLVI